MLPTIANGPLGIFSVRGDLQQEFNALISGTQHWRYIPGNRERETIFGSINFARCYLFDPRGNGDAEPCVRSRSSFNGKLPRQSRETWICDRNGAIRDEKALPLVDESGLSLIVESVAFLFQPQIFCLL